MELSIDASQFLRLADVWKQAPDMLRDELLQAVTQADVLVQGELMQKLPAGAGGRHGAGLIESVHHSEEALADSVIGMVATDRSYAQYVEIGTKPHMPPLQPLVDWANAVIEGVHAVAGTNKKGKPVATGAGAEIVEAIRWSIYRRGTRKQPVWQTTYDKLLPQIQQLLEAAVQRVRDRLAGGAA